MVTKLTRDVSSGMASQRSQFLVEPREGVGADGSAVEERGGQDGYGCIEECNEVSCDC